MPVVALLVLVALISLIITRVATIALTVTGMARPAARFQARSALSGVGFTTSESESVVNHPARRRIIMILMLVGNVGLTTSVAGLLAGFLGADNARQALLRTALLIGGLGLVYALSLSQAVDRHLSRIAARALRRFTDLDVRDYEGLLRVSGEYEVNEMLATPDGWLTGRTLADLALRREGVVVLGISKPDGSYVGAPAGTTKICAGDTLIAYGRGSAFEDLSRRRPGQPGDEAHARAVDRQQTVAEEERRRAESDSPMRVAETS